MRQENPIAGTKLSIVDFYRKQLAKFNEVGLGKKTEFNVTVTKELIEITQNRLAQLSVTYESSLSIEGKYSRERQRKIHNTKLPAL